MFGTIHPQLLAYCMHASGLDNGVLEAAEYFLYFYFILINMHHALIPRSSLVIVYSFRLRPHFLCVVGRIYIDVAFRFLNSNISRTFKLPKALSASLTFFALQI